MVFPLSTTLNELSSRAIYTVKLFDGIKNGYTAKAFHQAQAGLATYKDHFVMLTGIKCCMRDKLPFAFISTSQTTRSYIYQCVNLICCGLYA